uniref:GH16 domain-containing protein n=1 Tax=Kwoniella dejecticola CBS 10117 TaxID=1296121 RepID=A0A1A5ZUL6_9TREE|nr:uncharacterized protein I303_08268 [Kwoniella dejecticola CBS 10117]OBR81498.1 hypothetical protein I303_08268 [Kwoniella dejecticola CBS 10117]
MAPSYPWSRAQPSASSSSSSSANQQNQIQQNGTATPTQRTINEGRTRVISATGVQQQGQAFNSPALNRIEGGLGVGSPSVLRSRIASPNYSNTITQANVDSFQSESDSYPSPVDSLKKGKSKKGSKGGWIELTDHGTPSPKKSKDKSRKEIHIEGLPNPVPRYDPRGYPTKSKRYDDYAHHLDYGRTDGLGLKTSRSQDSLRSASSASDVSSTGAGVNEETSNFLSTGHGNKQSYYMPPYSSSGSGSASATGSSSSHSNSQGPSPVTAYPPNLDYSLSSISYSPYETNDVNRSGLGSIHNPLPSLYGDSRVSLNSLGSGESSSAAHLRQHDHLKYLEHGINSDDRGYGYSNFSISSKGGKKHLADMFSLPADPATWSNLGPEPDDDFHDPDYRPLTKSRFRGAIFTWRGAANLGCLAAMLLVLVVLFAGYPILDNYLSTKIQSHGAYNLGGINATGQIPDIGAFQLIDKDTPQSAYTWQSLETGDQWELIFSDEFNRDGRSFFDGDDPYWEAVDLHYWQTNNLEWYDPRMVTTKGGNLEITLDKVATNGMNYTGAMISTWNRLCFTGGYVEASVSLPGTSNVYGLWPAIWAMGNLGRAGYGGSLDGMWPYSYDSCDVGTLPNQTLHGKPALTATDGDPTYDNALSYLPGQRLSRCTCPNDQTHPGPKLSNGTFRGRSAPEIDMFEATVDSTLLEGEVSQSGQWAPYNPHYYFLNTSSKYYEIYDDDVTKINTYMGSVYQQATSGLSVTDQVSWQCCFSTYGFEYSPGADGYITWVNNAKKAWTVRGAAMGPNADAMVGQRLVSEEPMYLIINLGISENFGAVDYDGLEKLWPVKMQVDYIRVYQDPNARNIGCDPDNMPTAKYISLYPEIYSNPNITVMGDIPNFTMPKNSLVDTC